MKATLVFDLHEDQDSFDHARRGHEYLMALESLAQAFRYKAKHSDPDDSTWTKAKDLFWDTLKVDGVELP